MSTNCPQCCAVQSTARAETNFFFIFPSKNQQLVDHEEILADYYSECIGFIIAYCPFNSQLSLNLYRSAFKTVRMVRKVLCKSERRVKYVQMFAWKMKWRWSDQGSLYCCWPCSSLHGDGSPSFNGCLLQDNAAGHNVKVSDRFHEHDSGFSEL